MKKNGFAVVRRKRQRFSGADGASYKKTDTSHTVRLSNGNGISFTAESYGEGWKSGYHVRQTDYVGGEFIDRGKVNGIKIGQSVLSQVRNSGDYSESGAKDIKSAKVVMAHKYPNGEVDYNVEIIDRYGHRNRANFSGSSLKSKSKRK